jgi:uncharacterized alkaline shock family protein YloU
MSEKQPKLGKIRVAPTAIASIVSQAVLKSYGVTGMASRNLVDDIAGTITHDPNRGILVHLDNNQVRIDVYVIIAYGTRIRTVADSIINAVRFEVEKALGIPVEQVNVYVQGLHMSDAE